MSRHCRPSRPPSWHVVSVTLRKRDAQQRMDQVYRVLLNRIEQASTLNADLAEKLAVRERSHEDACRRLRQSLHRAPGTPTDH